MLYSCAHMAIVGVKELNGAAGDSRGEMSNQEDFDGADDVHRRGDGCAEVEQDADSTTELWTESSRDHEIRAPTGDNTIRRDRTHRHRRRHRLHTYTVTRKKLIAFCQIMTYKHIRPHELAFYFKTLALFCSEFDTANLGLRNYFIYYYAQ